MSSASISSIDMRLRPLTRYSPLMPGGHASASLLRRTWHSTLPRQGRARADERHLAAQNVDELRKFTDAETAQNVPYPGNPRVSLQLVDAFASVTDSFPAQLPNIQITVSVVAASGVHCPQLQQGERSFVQADARLAEQNGPTACQPH